MTRRRTHAYWSQLPPRLRSAIWLWRQPLIRRIVHQANRNGMNQGFSGSQVTRTADVVVKKTSDIGFVLDSSRHSALQRLSQQQPFLPTIYDISGDELKMEYIPGEEGLSLQNARKVGSALKRLHNLKEYPFPVFTGIEWLHELAEQALTAYDREAEWLPPPSVDPDDLALIHTEPVQIITRADGTVVFIDIEGIGMGSKYQDLGFIYYTAAHTGKSGLFDEVLLGYGSAGVNLTMVAQMAGLISIAYSTFADSKARIDLGLRLLRSVQ